MLRYKYQLEYGAFASTLASPWQDPSIWYRNTYLNTNQFVEKLQCKSRSGTTVTDSNVSSGVIDQVGQLTLSAVAISQPIEWQL